MSKYKEPKVGDTLFFEKYGFVTVKERGVFDRGYKVYGGKNSTSKYSIVEDSDGNIVTYQGHTAWFYDELLTEANFKSKRRNIKDCKFWKPRGNSTHHCSIDINDPLKRCFGVCGKFESR